MCARTRGADEHYYSGEQCSWSGVVFGFRERGMSERTWVIILCKHNFFLAISRGSGSFRSS